ncbi:hypothetical protein [Salinarchaeum laminariae]|uniref:hypothetical protein n=1 Tax=Salinarchaeum laminariae TaxID=869888 RepID=UPI0020BE88F1|nr:hypothetical protein [Salinarchaeum laminariae]
MTDGEDWESVRLEVIHGEARSVLESQNETMVDIDDKATKTVRFNAVLIGLLLTAGRFAGAGVFDQTLLHASLASLVVSAVVGIVTYGESSLYVGPGGTYFERATERSTTGSEWDRDLLEGYAGMILENEETIAWNSWLLTVTQATLVIGVATAVLATAI